MSGKRLNLRDQARELAEETDSLSGPRCPRGFPVEDPDEEHGREVIEEPKEPPVETIEPAASKAGDHPPTRQWQWSSHCNEAPGREFDRCAGPSRAGPGPIELPGTLERSDRSLIAGAQHELKGRGLKIKWRTS